MWNTSHPLDYDAGKAVYIPETGLYQLIFTSKLEAAERFGSWVFEEVLTSICKTGGYELQALKNEIMLKDKAHQKDINNVMKQLTLKDRQLTLKDEQHAEELAKRDKELNEMKLRCLKLSDQNSRPNHDQRQRILVCHDESLLSGTKQVQN